MCGGAIHPIEDLPDGGEVSKNHECKRCLEFYSGYLPGLSWGGGLIRHICNTCDLDRVVIYNRNDLQNNNIKSESLFDHFLVPKTTFFKIWVHFGLFSSGFAFWLHGPRARQYTQNDVEEHLCTKINFNKQFILIMTIFGAKTTNRSIWS